MQAMTGRPGASLDGLGRACGELLIGISGDPCTEVGGVAYDSRKVRPGDLFVCVGGTVADGHDFAPEAIAAGAAAVVVERPLGLGVPEVRVTDARRAMARIAAAWYGHPADRLMLLGVTGTNGKTTTAYLLESILSSAGHATGLIGTIETRVGERVTPGVRTTPESVDLQRLFADMLGAGVDAVAMEVTSHALALHRVEGVRFAAVGFTNLTQDHLDFHGSMERYFAAKRSLFTPEHALRGAANADDPYGRVLLEERAIDLIGFGTAPDAQVRLLHAELGTSSTSIAMATPAGELEVETPLVGSFNVSNCLAACAIALQAGVSLDAIGAGLQGLRAVPGRFEAIDEGQPFTVVVDYAHTPDSLDNVLREARRLATGSGGRVVAVFGCGGDRDRGKRPIMGSVAARLADIVIVTSDNPRSEDPMAIVAAIVEGVRAHRPEGPDAVVPDRAEAIARAVAVARPGDVVVIAGKGHETGQTFATHTVPFDDREVARRLLRGGAR